MNKKTIKDKKAIKIIKKVQKAVTVSCTATMFMLSSALTTFAANAENSAPVGVQTSTMNDLIGIVFFILRAAILIGGGAVGLYKIVNGQANEDTRERNAGFTLVAITALVFAATFAIQNLI